MRPNCGYMLSIMVANYVKWHKRLGLFFIRKTWFWSGNWEVPDQITKPLLYRLSYASKFSAVLLKENSSRALIVFSKVRGTTLKKITAAY